MLAAYPLIAPLLARTAERLTPDCNQREEVVQMNQPCTAVGVASHNHKIYAIGGECAKTPRETHYLKSVQLYDPMHNTWTNAADMQQPCTSCFICKA